VYQLVNLAGHGMLDLFSHGGCLVRHVLARMAHPVHRIVYGGLDFVHGILDAVLQGLQAGFGMMRPGKRFPALLAGQQGVLLGGILALFVLVATALDAHVVLLNPKTVSLYSTLFAAFFL
jgi:hypothetical protein